MKTKVNPWRFTALILSWLVLAALFTLLNNGVSRIDQATFNCLMLVSAIYLIATTSMFKPLTKVRYEASK